MGLACTSPGSAAHCKRWHTKAAVRGTAWIRYVLEVAGTSPTPSVHGGGRTGQDVWHGCRTPMLNLYCRDGP